MHERSEAMDDFLTVSMIAELLGVTKITVQRWLREGKIDGKKFGKSWRVSKEELKKILPDEK